MIIAVAEVYDEGYINMAPSGATAKPFVRNGRNGNCKIAEQQKKNCVCLLSFTVPLPPGMDLLTMGESTDEPYNHYDRIPAERRSKGDNVYDEVNLRGARMLCVARSLSGGMYKTNKKLTCIALHYNDCRYPGQY